MKFCKEHFSIKMCSNILKWSLCLFFLLLYFCPYIHAQIHGYHHSHGIDQASPSTGTATTLDINNNNNNDSGEKCPCIPRDQCPRVYGEAATDVKELGFLRPCRQFGTVRCCGVTVSVSTTRFHFFLSDSALIKAKEVRKMPFYSTSIMILLYNLKYQVFFSNLLEKSSKNLLARNIF